MTSFRTSAPAQQGQPGQDAAEPAPSPLLGWSATAALGASLLIMVAAGLLRASWMPRLDIPGGGAPWQVSAHVAPHPIIALLWVGGVLAVGGLVAGLLAVRRGQPVPVRTLLWTAAAAVLAMTVLPPFGSTDPLDYAVYGHIVGLGHSPYVMTPAQFRAMTRAIGVPTDWQTAPSVYGPLATAEQFLAAKLGGASLARAAFWLKLVNALAFGAVAVTADRLLRGSRAARVRAHLFWTANPLIIWSVIAGGHLDVLAAAAGVAGLLVIDRQPLARPLANAALAGLCVGIAADIKAIYALFGLAVAWALRRELRQLAVAVAGGAAVLLPSYAIAGIPALKALTARASTGLGWGFYGFIFRRVGIPLHYAVPLAVCLLIPVGWLALRRFPAGYADRPAVRAALALSLAWLLVWPHQFAWYSVMAICVLIFYPISRLDWLALTWLSVMTIANMPGIGFQQGPRLGPILRTIQHNLMARLAPLVMLVALVALVTWCVTRRWDEADGESP